MDFPLPTHSLSLSLYLTLFLSLSHSLSLSLTLFLSPPLSLSLTLFLWFSLPHSLPKVMPGPRELVSSSWEAQSAEQKENYESYRDSLLHVVGPIKAVTPLLCQFLFLCYYNYYYYCNF